MSTSKVLQSLYSFGVSSPALLPILYYLIRNDEEEKYIASLHGSELSLLVDFLDKALDTIPITDEVAWQCLLKLRTICGERGILPSSYNVSGKLSRSGDSPIGFGGFADVWEGFYNERKVCIKRPRTILHDRQVCEKMFYEEAVMWKRLRHPNIVPFIGITRDPLEFVSEWMPNGTVTEYLSKYPDVDRVCLLLDVAEGLTFLHANHTIHGDLKAPNILIDHSGRARLTDFGFASVFCGSEPADLTRVQGFTTGWIAPEVLMGDSGTTRAADVFSFGMVVVEVFPGKCPFSEFSFAVALAKTIDGERPDRPQTPDLTYSIWYMTLRCLLKDPAQRPAMAEVVGTLRKCRVLRAANLPISTLATLPPAARGHNPRQFMHKSHDSTDSGSISTHPTNTGNVVNAKPVTAWTTDVEQPSNANESAGTSWDPNQLGSQPSQLVVVHPRLKIKSDGSRGSFLPPDVSRYATGLPGSEEASQYVDVYGISEGGSGGQGSEASGVPVEIGEPQTGVLASKCYAPRCAGKHPCYAYSCPKRARSVSELSSEIPPLKGPQSYTQERSASSPSLLTPAFGTSSPIASIGEQIPPSGSRSARGFSEARTDHSTLIPDCQSPTPVNGHTQEILANDEPPPVVDPDSDSSVTVNVDIPTWKRLCSGGLLPHEVISLVEVIFTNRDEVKVICDLCGGDARTVVDVIHKILDLQGLPQYLWRKCLSALYKICSRQAFLPKSLQIPICYSRSGAPRYCGGFADVWKGEYQGRDVAVKVLRVSSISDLAKITRRFCKEVLTWNTLRHPNVLSLLGVITDGDQFAMVSEWMANGNINEFTKAHGEVNRFELLQDVATGLIYIHNQAMIHGDLKGANILVDENGRVRLADFGLLTIVSNPTYFTASSSVLAGGTVRWMSPELLEPEQFGMDNDHPTKESDCYALGMVIYETLSGQPPFAPLKERFVTRRVLRGERPGRPEGAIGALFMDQLWEMLGRCWESQAQNRPNIGDVLECLKQVSDTWKPLPVNEDVEMDENGWDLTAGSLLTKLMPNDS